MINDRGYKTHDTNSLLYKKEKTQHCMSDIFIVKYGEYPTDLCLKASQILN